MVKDKEKSRVVEFVGNLNRSNLDEHIDIILDSVDVIMAVFELTISGLERITRIHHDTLRKILKFRKKGMFKTYNKLNNFVKRVIIAEEKNDKHFGFESTEVERLVLDENFTGDIN
jgi:hypothetical protein